MRALYTALAILLATPAFAQEKSITITLPLSKVQMIINVLAEQKWRDVNDTLQILISQSNEQLKPPAAAPKE